VVLGRTLLYASGLLLASAVAWAEQGEALAFPVTVPERLAACVAAEDNEPAHAIALADSVLAEGVALNLLQRAEALGCRGWSNVALGQTEPARRDAHSLRSLVQQLPRDAERVRLTRRAGGILHRAGDRIGAVDLYAQAVGDAEALGLEAERIPLLINLGVLHSEFEEHERARVNYEQALALMDRLGDHRHEAPVRYNLGLNLSGQRRFAEAIPQLQRTLELIRESGMGGPMQEMSVSIALASALQQTGATQEARQLIDRVRGMDVPIRDVGTRMQLVSIEASLLAEAGDPAAALALLAPFDAELLGHIQQWSLLRQRASLLEQLGRFQEAAEVQRSINEIRETYLRSQNHERLAALESHLRDREQRLELERLQVEAEEQELRLADNARNQLALAMGAGLLLSLGIVVLIWQRRMNRRLDRASRTDPLTGLANRRDMAERLRAISLVNASAAVLLIDIDLFKRINDEHGHDVGDDVLVAFAQRLQAIAGQATAVARWGGEEFLVMLEPATRDSTSELAERLRLELAAPIVAGTARVQTHVSIGYANLPLPGAHGAEAWQYSLQLADSALYLAKAAGRDAWVGYWLDRPIPDWPVEKLSRDPRLARSLGLLVASSSRPLRAPLTAVG
jgi:diguanylate cyclase (GGDEF)-like protein